MPVIVPNWQRSTPHPECPRPHLQLLQQVVCLHVRVIRRRHQAPPHLAWRQLRIGRQAGRVRSWPRPTIDTAYNA
jgi:hypothetical protein